MRKRELTQKKKNFFSEATKARERLRLEAEAKKKKQTLSEKLKWMYERPPLTLEEINLLQKLKADKQRILKEYEEKITRFEEKKKSNKRTINPNWVIDILKEK